MDNTKNTNSNNTNSDNNNTNSSSSSDTDSNKSKSNNDNINASNDSSRQASPIKRLSSRLTIDSPTRHSSITTTTSSPRNSTNSRSNSGDIIVSASASSISGYLYKQTRDGRWQRRWFETNGTFLTYYKSRKMERLLAALSLPQVGTITKLSNDKDQEGKEGLFALELNTRVYYLRAKTDNEAEYWVSTLSRLRDEGLSNNDVQAIRISSNTSPTNIRNGQHGLAIQDSMQNNRSDWEKTSKYRQCLSRIFCCCLC